MAINSDVRNLATWYGENKRELPWRENRDPYRIWIAETMLQQTTTTAVIPYFERFLRRFPTLKDLAKAEEGEVFEQWSGLGYYSRARNLLRAARQLQGLGEFPRDYRRLLELPGFGPYTARSVASLAFGQAVGVVDGNVIRVLSRYFAKNWDWWRAKVRDEIQEIADAWAQSGNPYEVNQGLMELGRTICLPRSPHCLICPLRSGCQALAKAKPEAFPKPKPRREKEVWLWQVEVHERAGQVCLLKNPEVPFLKKQWTLPGSARQLSAAPDRYDFRHSITHHDIFVTIEKPKSKLSHLEKVWVRHDEVAKHAPASLVQKALRAWRDSRSAPRLRQSAAKVSRRSTRPNLR